MDILQEIAARTRKRIEEQKKILPPEILSGSHLLEHSENFAFENAIKESKDIALICEVKKASPSKGIIAEDFPYLDIAQNYEAAGAAAISVLTEPYYFMGSDKYLQEIRKAVKIPLLRKDFTVDPYMIYEARYLGADAVLFICAILDYHTLLEYMEIAENLGLSALVEVHNEEEVEMALKAGARIIGVNNRNLKTFEVDIGLSEKLRPLIPKGVTFIAESGIKTPGDISRLRNINAHAALIGESIMRSHDQKAAVKELMGG